jgi:hypothetical protein
MNDGTCTIPCYEEEEDCNLTIVKIFLAKHLELKEEPPILYKLNSIMWHGLFRFYIRKKRKQHYFLLLLREWSTKRSNKSNNSI